MSASQRVRIHDNGATHTAALQRRQVIDIAFERASVVFQHNGSLGLCHQVKSHAYEQCLVFGFGKYGDIA